MTAKQYAFDAESFRSDILEVLALNPKCYMGSIYDMLLDHYVKTGYRKIPSGNGQTLRNYVR